MGNDICAQISCEYLIHQHKLNIKRACGHHVAPRVRVQERGELNEHHKNKEAKIE